MTDTSDLLHDFFPECLAGGFTRIDSTVAFYTRVRALLRPDSVVLDFGAGRGRQVVEAPRGEYVRRLCSLRGHVRRVIGVDPDPVVLENPGLDEAHVLEMDADGEFCLPLPEQSVDIVISDWTFEHVTNPVAAARELTRVLRPGGWICVRTPNRWGYIALANRLIPEVFRDILIAKVQPERKHEDIFPAVYRMCSVSDLRRIFPSPSWTVIAWTCIAEPAYAGRSRLLWHAFRALDAVLPPPFRPILFAFCRKNS